MYRDIVIDRPKQSLDLERTIRARLPHDPTFFRRLVKTLVLQVAFVHDIYQYNDTVKEAISNAADKVANLTTSDNTPNLVLDEVTGESVSKSEFKKRVKQREKDAKKAEREATRVPPPQAKRKPANEAEDEGQLNPNVSHRQNAHTSNGERDTDRTSSSNTESFDRVP